MASDRLYLENLARDADDADSVYGLARNRSLAGDERAMADLLDLYLRIAPCGEQADRARDILWQLPREARPPRRKSRALARFRQAVDVQGSPVRSLRRARQSWQRGKTPEDARLLCQLYLRLGQWQKSLKYALAACRLAPKDLTARQLLATALYENKMPNACRSALRQAAALCEHLDQLPAFCGCAVCLEQADLAAELLEEKLRQHPGSADLMLLLASVLRDRPGSLARVRELAHSAALLDEENPMSELLETPRVSAAAEQVAQAMRQLQRVYEAASAEPSEEAERRLHAELVRAMRLPVPGMPEAAVRLFIKNADPLGLRMAMLENDLPPMLYGLILHDLEEMGQPLPCFARVEGRLTLLPQKPRPPYDPDLHDLIRALLRDLPESVPLDQVVREVPPLWRALPVSARRHFAQSRDDIWTSAFTARLLIGAGRPAEARERLNRSGCPRRAGRALMQLIRRSKKPYEVHRL